MPSKVYTLKKKIEQVNILQLMVERLKSSQGTTPWESSLTLSSTDLSLMDDTAFSLDGEDLQNAESKRLCAISWQYGIPLTEGAAYMLLDTFHDESSLRVVCASLAYAFTRSNARFVTSKMVRSAFPKIPNSAFLNSTYANMAAQGTKRRYNLLDKVDRTGFRLTQVELMTCAFSPMDESKTIEYVEFD